MCVCLAEAWQGHYVVAKQNSVCGKERVLLVSVHCVVCDRVTGRMMRGVGRES